MGLHMIDYKILLNWKAFGFLLIISLVSVGDSFSSDWKYYGSSSNKKELLYIFYDLESVMINNVNNIMVWVKTVSAQDTDDIIKKHKKEISEKINKNIYEKYIPAYSIVTKNTDYNRNMQILIMEVVTNNYSINTEMKMYWEIDCKEKKFRMLSMIEFNKGNVSNTYSGEGNWDYIAPDSNAETLWKIFCVLKNFK